MTSPPVSPLVNTDCLMEGDILQLEKYDILFNFSECIAGCILSKKQAVFTQNEDDHLR